MKLKETLWFVWLRLFFYSINGLLYYVYGQTTSNMSVNDLCTFELTADGYVKFQLGSMEW